MNKGLMETNVMKWVSENIDMPAFIENCKDTVEYFRETNEQPNEHGEHTVWTQEIINGAHGQYAMGIFINEVGKTAVDQEDIERTIELFDNVSTALATCLNEMLGLPGTLTVGFHEADNSIGIYYTEKA